MLRERMMDVMASTRLLGASEQNANEEQMKERRKNGQAMIDKLGAWLDDVDELVRNLESEDEKLGPAMQKKCHDIADGIGAMADRLEKQSPEEQEEMAKEYVANMQAALAEHAENSNGSNDGQGGDSQGAPAPNADEIKQHQEELKNMRPEDMNLLVSVSTSLLRDVEDAFRTVDEKDAGEVAEVAVTLARLILMSMHSVQYQVEGFVKKSKNKDGEDAPAGDDDSSRSSVSSSESDSSNEPTKDRRQERDHANRATWSPRLENDQRMRIIWQPLGPRVVRTYNKTKEKVEEKPVAATMIGAVLCPIGLFFLPFIVGTAMVGGGVVAADAVLQKGYDKLRQKKEPSMRHLECGVAQLRQTAELVMLLRKLAFKQSIRVVRHKVQRNGGWLQVGKNTASTAVDRAIHPFETAGMAWNATSRSVGAVSGAVKFMAHQAQQARRAQANASTGNTPAPAAQ